jgi:DNA sulfur modification protein DndE
MNHDFKHQVWKASFRPFTELETFLDALRQRLRLKHRYEAARLAIGRSLAESKQLDAKSFAVGERGKPISGELLFGDDEIDLWMSVLILDGQLGEGASLEDFRNLVEAHWARGSQLLRDEFESVGSDEAKFVSLLSELLPVTGGPAGNGPQPNAVAGEAAISLKVGSVSREHPGGREVSFVLNGPGAAPHIALMGKNGSGKTTTGIQIAKAIASQAGIPFLLIDPKGEFVEDGRPIGALGAEFPDCIAIEVGSAPIPLDFLPPPTVGTASVTKAALQLRDSIAACCKTTGDKQLSLLSNVIRDVVMMGDSRDLVAIRDRYERQLEEIGAKHDSVLSRLGELTALEVFEPELSAAEFFSKSCIISLKGLPSEDLKRLVILLVLDSLRAYTLGKPDSPLDDSDHRHLRHLLVIDEARRILASKRNEALVDLVRQGRSKGQVVILLSQDPSDFDGQADDFTTQLGTIIAFACAQSSRGLKALQGAFGRSLQPAEFSDTRLPAGVAFTKLPGRPPCQVQCWEPRGRG